MAEEEISQEFSIKYVDETKKYFVEQIEQNGLMSKKHKKVCTILNYIEQLLILASVATGRISISTFASLIGISIGITTRIKKYK